VANLSDSNTVRDVAGRRRNCPITQSCDQRAFLPGGFLGLLGTVAVVLEKLRRLQVAFAIAIALHQGHQLPIQWSETRFPALPMCIWRKLMQNAAPDPWVDPLFELRVRETAYFLWEQAGRPVGQEQQYWFEALDRCLRERQADEMIQEQPPALPKGHS